MNSEQQEPKTTSPPEREKVDVTSMSNLLISKDDIDFTMQIPFKEGKHVINKIILKKNDSQKRIELQSEVRYFIQKYLFNKETNEFMLGNKDYKNPVKKKIDKMSSNEAIFRKCLLELFDGHVVLFILEKDIDLNQYEKCLKEQKIPEEDYNKYEPLIYYRIGIDIILNPHPIEPTKIGDYYSFVNKFYEEIKYLILKENYGDAESWCNAAINKIFGMKKTLKKSFDEPKNSKNKKEILKLMKKIILNKTYCIERKPGDLKTSRYERGVKCVENEYYKYYPDDKSDDSYLKITARLCGFYTKMRQFENAEKTINEIKKNCSSLPNCASVIKTLQDNINNERGTQKRTNKKKAEYFLRELNQNPNFYSNDNFEWEPSIQNHNLEEYLSSTKFDPSIAEILK